MKILMRQTATAAIALAIGFAAVPADAQSLEDALASAYRSNPELLAQRSALRAVDEQVPRALSQWRPTVQVTGNAGPARDFNAVTTTSYGAGGSSDRVTTNNERVRRQATATRAWSVRFWLTCVVLPWCRPSMMSPFRTMAHGFPSHASCAHSPKASQCRHSRRGPSLGWYTPPPSRRTPLAGHSPN